MATGDSLPEAFKLEGLPNYQTWKMRMSLKENTWQYSDPTNGNVPRPGEGADVTAGRLKALYSICMSCREGRFSKISSCNDPRVAWNILAATYQQQTNAGRLMLKDKLNGLRLQEGASVTDYIRQVECLQSELRGLNSEVPESELLERMLLSFKLRQEPSFEQETKAAYTMRPLHSVCKIRLKKAANITVALSCPEVRITVLAAVTIRMVSHLAELLMDRLEDTATIQDVVCNVIFVVASTT